MGYQAAIESADEIRQALVDARMIFICAGLGGGTGSGAAPVVAQLAREAGSFVIVFATLPFSFEGKRRAAQAQEALARLGEIANAVICFENDRMGDMVAPKAGIHQAFAVADVMISQSVRSIVNLIQRPGLIRIGFDDLLSALRSQSGRCLFGFGESDSDNRAHDALTQALKNPLMDKGRMLADAAQRSRPGRRRTRHDVVGSRDTDAGTRDAMCATTRRYFSGRQSMGAWVIGSVSRSLARSRAKAHPEETSEMKYAPAVPEPAPFIAASPPIWEQQSESVEAVESAPLLETEDAIEAVEAQAPPTPEELIPSEAPVSIEAPIKLTPEPKKPAPGPRVMMPKKKPMLIREPLVNPVKPEKFIHAKQEVMQFEPVTRGRFEKSEPTIVEGQDLDIPTFLRKNVRVK